MKTRFFAAMVAVLFLAGSIFAQEPEKEKMMEDPMMKAWMEFATPGEPHKAMQNLVGTWDTTVKSYYPDPAKPTETKGTSTFTSVMDGRYITEKAEGNMPDFGPFNGMGVYGYDNLQKKYVSSWVDNMGTGIMTGEGTSDDGGKTINWTGTSSDPTAGKVQTYRYTMHMMRQD